MTVARVVLVVPNFPEPSETFIVSKARGLLARGFDVQIATFRHNVSHAALFGGLDDLQGRVTVIPNVRRRGGRWRAVRHWAGLVAAMSNADRRPYLADLRGPLRNLRPVVMRVPLFDSTIAGLRPDIVHFEFGDLAVDRCAVRHLVKCPVTVSFRGYDICLWRPDDPRAYDSVWPAVAAVHTLGIDLESQVIARGCPPSVPVRLIAPAIDLSFWSPDIPDAQHAPVRPGASGLKPLRVLSVGRLVPKKGYRDALHAVAILHTTLLARGGPEVEYHIAGAGPLLAELQALVDHLGLNDVVRFVGHLRPAGLRNEYRDAQIFLHTAESEGFGNAVIEAQAMGVPVVCTDAEGLSENVAPGVSGLVVQRGDVAELAAALVELGGGPQRRAAMGAAGMTRAQALFGLETQLDRWTAFYCGVLTPPVPAAG